MLDKGPGKGKFDSRSQICILVGYSDVSKAYKLWDPEAHKFVRSKDVKFTEMKSADEFEDFYKPDE